MNTRLLSLFALLLFAAVAVGCTCSPGRIGLRGLDGSIGMDADTRRDGSTDGDGSLDGSVDPDGSADRDGDVDPDGSTLDGSISDGGDGGTGLPLNEAICDDGVDQDGDGLIDCMDPDCDSDFCDTSFNLCVMGVCAGCRGEASETVCGDGVDDDCDGMVDCADSSCNGATCSAAGGVTCVLGMCAGCAEGDVERNCTDGIDGDCDGLTDCEDGDCMGRLCAIDGTSSVCMPPGVCACPGLELCQGTDDNCNMVIDEGCPQALDTCCETTPVNAGGVSGIAWLDACPTGAALVGVSGRAGSRIDQLQPICATVVFFEDGTLSPEHNFFVQTGAAIPGATHGATGAPTFTDQCPANEFVIGIEGHADMALDRIQLHCGSFTIRRGGGFNWQLSRAPTSTLTSRGSAGSGMMPFGADCGPNGVVTALAGRAGTFVTALAFNCRTLSLDLR